MTIAIALAVGAVIGVAVRSRDQLVKRCAGLAGTAMLLAYGALFVAQYRWVNSHGCRETFPEQFGYRAPNWEQAIGSVEDARTWWPIGNECSGTDVDSGEFVVMQNDWGVSTLVYVATGVAVLALIMTAIRVFRMSWV
ncbi:hypothetical protein [Rhodococcus sp. IEGM 1379]|uniref:hypothetical protein n=1 Tax=Rhodococcus sp. IEGM 1379 TaxID=3047086 RepID=UPI0024B77E87|nr:hypothetical protein [Rhodococcus sp. IEGM 1379]MDI9913837.1 hypothetical protein [Rhodococcus sp. IEGM 1379]